MLAMYKKNAPDVAHNNITAYHGNLVKNVHNVSWCEVNTYYPFSDAFRHFFFFLV